MKNGRRREAWTLREGRFNSYKVGDPKGFRKRRGMVITEIQ